MNISCQNFKMQKLLISKYKNSICIILEKYVYEIPVCSFEKIKILNNHFSKVHVCTVHTKFYHSVQYFGNLNFPAISFYILTARLKVPICLMQEAFPHYMGSIQICRQIDKQICRQIDKHTHRQKERYLRWEKHNMRF